MNMHSMTLYHTYVVCRAYLQAYVTRINMVDMMRFSPGIHHFQALSHASSSTLALILS